MLSGFAVPWLVSNNWDCLMSLWKNHALFLSFGSIILVFSLMLYLGWLGACSYMLDSYKVANCLYDHLVFDFWCHLMILLMSLCRFAWLWPLLLSQLVAPSLLLALALYWVWALLVHPTPKNQVLPLCPLKIPMHGICKPFQVNFHVLPLKTTFKTLLVLWHYFQLMGT
jgi:hypothetical protein